VNHDPHVPHSVDEATKRGWRNLDLAGKAGVISAWLAAISAVIAILAWLVPKAASDRRNGQDHVQGLPQAVPQNDALTAGGSTPPPATAPQLPAVSVSYLDGITPQAAGGNIVPLPRALRGEPAYASHPLVIRCPSNETGDTTSNVTYALNGHYLQVDATVRPYYPAGADQQSVTYVLADIGVREVDAEMTTRQAGAQQRANPRSPQPLTADVDGAQELTLKVACDDPRGYVVLTDARLTSGP
jgi:hypothetical protein